jgi:uncharacterized protein (DUF433 family)
VSWSAPELEFAIRGSWHAASQSGRSLAPDGATRYTARAVRTAGVIEGCTIREMAPLNSVVHSDPQILGGTPVFCGTRVPVKNLLDYLAAGDTLDEFLDAFPSVTREQAVAALELARDLLTAGAHPPR